MRGYHFDTVDSTNEEAKRLIRGGDLREPFYLLAREQTAGKGSRGRTWLSPKDAGIYLTVVEMPLAVDVAPTTAFTLAAGVACVEALQESADVTVQLKPINDLYVEARKLGGILTETVIQNGSVAGVITGVGINIHKADRALPPDAAEPICLAEILADVRFDKLDLNVVVATLVAKIRWWNAVVFAGRTERVEIAWERHRVPRTTLPGNR